MINQNKLKFDYVSKFLHELGCYHCDLIAYIVSINHGNGENREL